MSESVSGIGSSTSRIDAEFSRRRPEENGAGMSAPAAPDLSASYALSGTENPTSKIAPADTKKIPQMLNGTADETKDKVAFSGPSPEPQFGGLGVTGADGMQSKPRQFDGMA